MTTTSASVDFDHRYQSHLKHLKLKGLQPKTIDAYARNRDRFVPLPPATLDVLRRFWQTHRNPLLLFPNRHGGLKAAHQALTPLDRGGVQNTLRKVAMDCGLKKRLHRTACATVTPRT